MQKGPCASELHLSFQIKSCGREKSIPNTEEVALDGAEEPPSLLNVDILKQHGTGAVHGSRPCTGFRSPVSP